MLFLVCCSFPRPGTELTEAGVRFCLQAPNAQKVTVVGDFNQWDARRDRLTGPDEKGCWSRTMLLTEGRHEYLFLVDEKSWVPDPSVPSTDDGLGGRNSVIFVPKK
jgi:1,4-alpha-glucan branching enzyme